MTGLVNTWFSVRSVNCSTGFQSCLKFRLHQQSLLRQMIFSLSRLLLCQAHTITLVLMAWILSEIPQLLSSYFHLPSRRSVSVFVSQPPSVQIYLSITWAWRGSAPGRGVAGYFLSYFDSENVSICYYVGFRRCLRLSFPWGNGSFPVARRLIDAASLCLCGVCTDALADGVRLRHWSWSSEQVERVPQPHSCFPLCFPSAIRCYWLSSVLTLWQIRWDVNSGWAPLLGHSRQKMWTKVTTDCKNCSLFY